MGECRASFGVLLCCPVSQGNENLPFGILGNSMPQKGQMFPTLLTPNPKRAKQHVLLGSLSKVHGLRASERFRVCYPPPPPPVTAFWEQIFAQQPSYEPFLLHRLVPPKTLNLKPETIGNASIHSLRLRPLTPTTRESRQTTFD